MQLNFQDELMQWNRLTEEMLYLLIAIVGTVTDSTNTPWILILKSMNGVIVCEP